MIRDKEDFVDSEINSRLQELHYGESTDLHGTTWSSLKPNEIPTLYEVQKWLREEHNIEVSSDCTFYDYNGNIFNNVKYYYSIYDIENEEKFQKCISEFIEDYVEHFFDTYEEALNEGIKEALKFIQYE